MKAVILVGGFGTRMGEICKSIPKPMTEICGKPILLHQLETLKREGIRDFVFVTYHLSEKIEAFFGDGSNFAVNITYHREKEPLGTAGALPLLDIKEDFLLCNGDLIFDFDLSSMIDFHKKKKALLTLFVHPNNHPSDSFSFKTNENGQIIASYLKNSKPEFYPNLCNAGIQIISPRVFDFCKISGKADFDKDIVAPLIETGSVFAYRSFEYVHDAGTPERIAKIEKDVLKGTVSKRNRRYRQKAVFVDRDGTLNVHKGYITSPEELELINGTAEAITVLHKLGYLVIVITNQPVVARGDCSLEELSNIHSYLEKSLSEKDSYLDGIYFCPHHPDKGFEGEVEELKTECDCRKPQPGLIFRAQKDFNIDLSASFMVGDSASDVKAAENAGCTPVFIGDIPTEEFKSGVIFCNSLSDFSEKLSKKLINPLKQIDKQGKTC